MRGCLGLPSFCSSPLFEFCSPSLAWLQRLDLPQCDNEKAFFFKKKNPFCKLFYFNTSYTSLKSEFSQRWSSPWAEVGLGLRVSEFGYVWTKSEPHDGWDQPNPSLKPSGQVVTHWKSRAVSFLLASFSFTKHANPILLTISLKHVRSLPIYYCLP